MGWCFKFRWSAYLAFLLSFRHCSSSFHQTAGYEATTLFNNTHNTHSIQIHVATFHIHLDLSGQKVSCHKADNSARGTGWFSGTVGKGFQHLASHGPPWFHPWTTEAGWLAENACQSVWIKGTCSKSYNLQQELRLVQRGIIWTAAVSGSGNIGKGSQQMNTLATLQRSVSVQYQTQLMVYFLMSTHHKVILPCKKIQAHPRYSKFLIALAPLLSLSYITWKLMTKPPIRPLSTQRSL